LLFLYFRILYPEIQKKSMDAKTRAVKAHRARLKTRGMKRLEVSVPTREAPVIRRAASVLRGQSAEAAQLRQVLGFSREAGRPARALDLFAMTTPLSTAGEALWREAMGQVLRNRRDRTLNRARKVSL
jgi:hypothetical protein